MGEHLSRDELMLVASLLLYLFRVAVGKQNILFNAYLIWSLHNLSDGADT